MSFDLGSLLGGIIGGLFSGAITFYGVKKTIEYYERKDKQRDKKERFEKKPYFDIKRVKLDKQSSIDIDAFITPIKNVEVSSRITVENFPVMEKMDHVHFDYSLTNNGKSMVTFFDLACNYHRDTLLYPYDDDSLQFHVVNKLLCYSVYLDRDIKAGESINVRISAHKDRIITGNISAILSIIYQDEFGNRWRQPFFFPKDRLYEPNLITRRQYLDNVDFQSAIECFREPWKW